ncbi:Peroxidase [Trema orientale]|uniref:Peroxidase n=1 Tax=Trema orientale TaxID=63057 RepID=A0A2P5F4M5_TREOI|nr:Peroxidase [Trema orientale]
MKMKMNNYGLWMIIWVVSVLIPFSMRNPALSCSSISMAMASQDTLLEFDYYRDSCPVAHVIVRSAMEEIYSHHKDVSAALLRLIFHDCFVHGCDASVLLDDSRGNQSYSIEKQAVPNRSLRGFDKIDFIKEKIERVCPGVVSCADIISLAARDGIVLAGGPFYPVFTGRRDSKRSYFEEVLSSLPAPDDNITQILHLFSTKGFNERETVTLLGGHSIGKMSCEFIQNRLYNFKETREPDPTVAPDFLNQMRLKCPANDSSNSRNGLSRIRAGMSYFQELSSSMSSGAGFDTHYYRSLLMGRGLLFADQQMMARENTSRWVKEYASDDGSTFRKDFARVMMKLSNLNVLVGSQGGVRLNCSLPQFSSE